MTTNLIVDNREKRIMPFIKRSYITRQLGTSDFVIELLDNDTCKLVAMIERKTWKDLAASFKDGRYTGQKGRLIAATAVAAVYILIEGTFRKSATNTEQVRAALKTALRRASLRGINVVYTKTIAETAEWLTLFCRDIEELNRRGELWTPFERHVEWVKQQTLPVVDLVDPAYGRIGAHDVVAAKPKQNNRAGIWLTIRGVGADSAAVLQDVDISDIHNDDAIVGRIAQLRTKSGNTIGLKRANHIVTKFRESNLLFLKGITGVSANMARVINAKYLFEDFMKLSAVNIADFRRANGRRLGNVLGNRIYETIHKKSD